MSICNLFQTGLLAIVEEGYGVNTWTTDKLNQLISQSNYIDTEYSVKVSTVLISFFIISPNHNLIRQHLQRWIVSGRLPETPETPERGEVLW